MEARTAWLITESGNPHSLSFGNVMNPSQEADTNIRDWASALSDDQEADANFTATTTAWKSAPPFAMPGLLDHASSGATLSGRTLSIAGVSWDLDDGGRPQGSGMENFPPDATLVDANLAVAFAEALTSDLEFVEAGTLKKVRVWSTKDPADPYEGGFDSALYRQNADSVIVRVDA